MIAYYRKRRPAYPPLMSFLPYADEPLSSVYRSQAELLIKQQCSSMPPLDAEKYLGRKMIEPTSNVFLMNELERVTSRDYKLIKYESDERYTPLEEPLASAGADTWTESINSNSLVLENLRNNEVNSELQVLFAQSAWKIYAQTNESLLLRYKSTLKKLMEDSNRINQERKGAQIVARKRIETLESSWNEKLQVIQSLRQMIQDMPAAKRQKTS